MKKGIPKESMKILLISTDSDAVFHEESEYAIGLMIRVANHDISSIFQYYSDFSFCKKMQKWQKCGKSISPISQWKYNQILKILKILPSKWSA